MSRPAKGAVGRPRRVLVAGVGGASLGTEVVKALLLAGHYRVFTCDISPLAFGLFHPGVEASTVVSRRGYVSAILELCSRWEIEAVIPGGEEPTYLLGAARARFEANGLALAANSAKVTRLCADKARVFARLRKLGVDIPVSHSIARGASHKHLPYPCVIKPAEGSGGSTFVFLAKTAQEAGLYIRHLHRNGKKAVVQEYVPEDRGGEFTVGVLSLPNGRLVGSVALRRSLQSKLSVTSRDRNGVISSGYSQGHFADYAEVRSVCEKIALGLDSRGPLNVQGRLVDGRFLPFEINGRFSASTYLRALAGVNEVDLYLEYLLERRAPTMPQVRPGQALRSFSEIFVPD